MKYVGYTSYPTKDVPLIDPENLESASEHVPEAAIAKQAIVFMLCGLNKHFQYPVAYHFIDQKMDASDRNILLKEVIIRVSECNVKISNLTFDGLADNFAACEALGANLDANSPNFQPFFYNPHDGSRIYIVLDPCHMEKLARNTLGNKSIFFDDNDDKILWNHFVQLEKISRENGLFTHKLSRRHVEYKRNIMNVRVAAETFSESVANSMEILRKEGHPLFEDAKATIRFTNYMDKIFNVFNSRFTRNKNIFKTALDENNKSFVFSLLDECSTYLSHCKYSKPQ